VRPEESRLVGGVCAGIAERFGLRLWTVRAVVIGAMLTTPIVLLFYLLAWLAIPDEAGAVSYLQLSAAGGAPAERFALLTHEALERLGVKADRSPRQRQTIAFMLLAIAFALQLPNVEGPRLYYLHPLLATLYAVVTRFGGVFFYLSVAVALFASRRGESSPLELRLPSREHVLLDAGPHREIGGLLSGVASVIRTQPVVLRVLFVFLNIMTFGIAGLIYLVVVWMLKREGRVQPADELEHAPRREETEPALLRAPARAALGSIFVLLALTRLVTELRLFFFNEPFLQGIALIVAGSVAVWSVLTHGGKSSREYLWLLVACAVVLTGVYELSTTLFRVQLSLPERFAVTYSIVALGFLYFALVTLRGNAQRVAFAIVGLLFLAAALVELNVAPSRFLLALVEFYGFFYPVIFAGFGLWLILEK
jgi:phage shock protein PspC (stress-responsive transcriptional regulator)